MKNELITIILVFALAISQTTVYSIASTINGNSNPVNTQTIHSDTIDKGQMLEYATLFGGTDQDSISDIEIDSSGNIYIVGLTSSTDLPTTEDAINSSYNGGTFDGYIAKFSPNHKLVYSTYFGGSSIERFDQILITDNSIYISGDTASSDFPATSGFNTTKGGSYDIFLMKFSLDFDLQWSTFIGGSDSDTMEIMKLDSDGNIVIGGYSQSDNNYPLMNEYQSSNNGGYDMVFTKVSPNGELLWSTYLGGSLNDFIDDIQITEHNHILFSGNTQSKDFPVLNAYKSSFTDTNDLIIGDFSSNGILQWSSFFGGSQDEDDIQLTQDADGNIYTGFQTASDDFPTLNYDPIDNSFDEYIGMAKWSENGDLLWSKIYSGTNNSYIVTDLTVDDRNQMYLFTRGVSDMFPLFRSYNQSSGFTDTLLTQFDENGKVHWSNVYGGGGTEVAASLLPISNGRIILSGETFTDLPISSNALNLSLSGSSDGYYVVLNIPNGDYDDDGIINYQEWGMNTDFNNADTDGDNIPDGFEISHGLNPITDDASGDLDNDGMDNLWEYQMDLDPTNYNDASYDNDEDGLSNFKEFKFGTDANHVDTDRDGLSDWEEIYETKTDPTLNDTDGDGVSDLKEVIIGSDPLNENITDSNDINNETVITVTETDILDEGTESGFLPILPALGILGTFFVISIIRAVWNKNKQES